MSFDVMLFDPSNVSANKEECITWIERQYNLHGMDADNDRELENSSDRIKQWCADISMNFEDFDPKKSTCVVSVRDQSILFNAPWRIAVEAFDTAFQLAQKYGLAVVEISAEEPDVWMPTESGELHVMFKWTPSPRESLTALQKVLDKLKRLFNSICIILMIAV